MWGGGGGLLSLGCAPQRGWGRCAELCWSPRQGLGDLELVSPCCPRCQRAWPWVLAEKSGELQPKKEFSQEEKQGVGGKEKKERERGDILAQRDVLTFPDEVTFLFLKSA